MESVNIQHVENNYTNHFISYYIKNGDVYLHDIKIDYDDVKTFASMLVEFCNDMHKNKIKNIRQIAGRMDYEQDKSLFSEFKVKIIDNNLVEFITSPLLFPKAMFKGLGLFNTGEENKDKKF